MNGTEIDETRPAAHRGGRGGRAVPRAAFLHGLFEEQAARTPDAVAVVDGDLRWTYAGLNRRAAALARHLAGLGVGPEVRVGLCLERSAGLIAALLGVLKAGGAYVPLDPAYPRERLAHMLADSGAEVLLTQERLLGILPPAAARTVLLDGFDPDGVPGEDSDLGLQSGVLPANLAYVIYTSGSTGRPKGVAVEHRTIVAMIEAACGILSPAELAGTLFSSSVCFDLSVLELFTTLASGGALVVAENALALPSLPDPSLVTMVDAVPSAMAELVRQGGLPPSVRTVCLGAEPLRRSLADRVYATGHVERLYNLYGPTEDSIYSTISLVPRDDPREPSIGTPIEREHVLLADPWYEARLPLAPARDGGEEAPAELLIGGAGITRGYLGRPDLTAERFVPDPLGSLRGEPGARVYRTGDLVKTRTAAPGAFPACDWELVYLGRIDFQVKIRGFRIELGEVEVALQSCPGVADGVVMAREDTPGTPGDKKLVAYVVPAGPEAGLSPAGLRATMAARLPDYMLPSAFVFLDVLPLNPNGKVDRKNLPAPDASAEVRDEGGGREVAAPRTATEALLVGIWEKVLGLDFPGVRAGVDDDFFALGGHSLLATRAVSQVRDAFGVEIPLAVLFESPTPAGLAERLEALRRAEGGEAGAVRPPVTPVPRQGPEPAFPLSHSQERLWLIERLTPGTSAYNAPAVVELRGKLDVDAWRRTLSEIARRHEVLRTVYRPTLDGAVQVVLPAAPLPVPLVDLSGLPAGVARPEGLRLTDEDARLPFDLERGPVLRAALVRLSSDHWIAWIHAHHIATDGWSMGVLAAEIQALYPAYAAGRASPLPELPVQYADYAVWQRSWLEGEGAAEIAAQLAEWRRRLAPHGAPDAPLELPADRPRSAGSAAFRYRGASVPLALPPERVRPLRALARRAGGTLFMAFAAGFQALLARLTGREAVSLGTPLAGRTRSEIEPLIGFFLNTVVLRTDLGGDPTFAEAVARARETALAAQANQDVPFDRVVAEVARSGAGSRAAGSSPLIQVLLVLDTTPFEALGLPGLRSTELRPDRGAAIFDLTLSLAERDEGAVGWLEYSSDLFDPATAERLAAAFAALAGGAALDPETRLSDLPVLSPAERRQLLGEWSGAGLPVPPRPETMHGWFERQADLTPDAVALVFADAGAADSSELTYAELDARANRVAHRLAALGIGPDDRVGLFVERSVDMMVATLGVLKAGAAYLALDPSYPRERTAVMAADAGIAVLLTQRPLRAAAPAGDAPVLLVEDMAAEGGAAHRLESGATAANLIYLTYTSGSTGRPKGIGMTHGAIGNLIAWQLTASRMGVGDATLQFASLSFDVSFQEMFATWCSGGALVLIPADLRLEPAALLALIERRRIARLFLPPVFLQQLAQAAVETGAAPRSIAEVAVAGEQLQITPAVQTFFQRLPGAVLANHYGPSETHVITALDLPADPASWPALPAIGQVIPGVRAHLLDRNLHLVPTGVPGELYAGGGGLARGYLGRPDLTAERFVPDPFAGQPGARLYRTGDLARFRADGILDFLGRADSQVKIRGFRVEPLEVEAVLAAQPGVAECAVVPRRSPAGELQLIAWVVPADPANPATLTPRQLREDLLGPLPEYMVPARFLLAESLPQTPSGKLDRRALAGLDLPEEAAEAGRPESDLPRTPTEELLAGLWARVLRRERAGRLDNFFELGGHSLLATQIASRVRDTFGVDLPARAVFEHPTPAALAERVESARGGPAAAYVLPPIVPVGRDRPLPVTYIQERLWLLEQMQSRGVYHIPIVLRIEGRLDAATWLRSLAEVRRRHEALRSVFQVTFDGLVQTVTPAEEPWPQTVVDLTGLPVARREAERARLALAESVAPFDLAAGPLVRSLLVRLAEEDHAALLNFHHAVFDGWSVGLLLDELEALYPAFLDGLPSPLAELPVQYPDYAVWLREQWEGGGRARLDAQLAYWRRQLTGDAPGEVPADRPRPAVQSFRGGDVAVEVPEEIGRGLRALGREVGSTMFMAIATGFQVLIARLAGQTEASLGTAVAGRGRVEIERLIGCFINELVLRTDLGGEPTFADALRRVREVTLEAHAHQDLPFERLLQELRPESSLAIAPLFHNLLIHVGTPPERLSLPDLRVSEQHSELGIARLDLTLWLWERGDAAVGFMEYSSDLFDRATVARLVRQLQGLLAAGAASPGARISDLPLLTDAERRQILEDWSGAGEASPYPGGLTLHEALAAQADRTPDAVAARYRGRELTYAELESRANRLARHLVALGVGPEVRVGLYLERSLDLLAALLAVLKAGGAYLPLDPSHPRERLAGMLEDSRARVLITQGGGALSHEAHLLVDLDADRDGIAALPDTPLGRTADPDNLAYLLYTSGSTGRPKGVQIPHRAVLNFLPAIRERIGFQPGGVTLALTTLSFDISVLEVFLPLVTGGRMELAGKEEATDPALLGRLVAESGVTLLQATPTTWRLLAQSGWEGDPGIQGLCGGEPLPPDLAALLLERLGSLWNVYGPTEATVWSAAGVVRPGEPIAIGPSLPNLRHYLLDPWLQPVPPGVPADLWIGGAGVGRGYWDRADLTADAFRPDPFDGTGDAGARMYRTGDRGRWLADGRIELLGRADSQVKVRGFRIELGEVEAALAGHPQVREGLVLTRQDAGPAGHAGHAGDTRLVAFLIPRQGSGAAIPVRELRDFLHQRLPDYMVPSAFVQLDRFPLNPSGKVDRKALLALEAGGASHAADIADVGRSAAPRTFAEELLTGSWAEVLGREQVGVHDNFFELGGHSLLAAQIAARIHAVFGITLPVRALFEAPTPAALAARIELALRLRSGAGATAPIVPVPRDIGDGDGDGLPLSFSQEQLWILDQIQPGGVYNLPYALRLEGPLDAAAWRGAVAAVRRRHEALRTTFPTRPDGGASQRIAPPEEPWPQPFVDLSGLPEGAAADSDAEALRLTHDEAGRPFDLAAGPLLRSSLVRLGPELHFALLTVHHIAMDGWSMGLLLGEIERLYEAFMAGQPSPLPELPVQYADYAVWQREQMRGDALEAQLAYWRLQLAGEPELELPADRPRPMPPAAPTFRGDLLRVHLPAGDRHRVADLGRAAGATLFMTLLAAFEALLHRLSGSADFTVGTPVANRGRTEIEDLIGFFVNTLVIRADVAGNPSFAELLGRVRDTALGAYTHQDVPFEKLVEELSPERRLDRNPLFQVTFTFQPAGAPLFERTGLLMRPLATHSGMSKFDLGLFVGEDTDGSLLTLWEFSTELFERATVARFASAFAEILAGASAAPATRLGDLPLLTAAETAQLLAWNPISETVLPWASLHEGFAAQAARDPHAVAVSFEEGGLTYGELEDCANRLAWLLVAEGVGPDVPVGLCAERSLELVVGVLGILKAGGAYVPLDPAYPQERLAFIAEDSGAKVVVAQAGVLERLARRKDSKDFNDNKDEKPGGAGASLESLLSFKVVPLEDAPSPARALPAVSPGNAAYVIYTSGSTGQPKGVVVTHANALRLFAATDPWFGFGPGDSWTLFHSYAFDFSVWEIWGALLYGGRLVVVPYFVSRSPESFAGLLRRERITVLNQTPSAFDALSRVILAEGAPLPDLRYVVFGGEAISLRALEPWLDRFGDSPSLVNMYGITETTVHVTWRPLSAADPRSGETPFGSPIGVPIPDLSVHLLDRYFQMVPVGVAGEMLVGGAGLARGYLRRPDLTAERFVPDPFSALPGARLYRSGDLARRHADGSLEFLGRADAQVKIRGFRIEPGEIEAVLARLPEVMACAVLPRQTPEGDTALAAYVVPSPGAALAPARLREALLASLPEHMVPAGFLEIAEIPLTPSGKVDRRALSRLAPARAAAGPDETRTAPRSLTEEVLAGLWLDLLGEERTGGRAGVHDDFFALGGHSLLAARLINRLRTAFGVDLPLRALFEAPTPARLAEKVDALLREEAGAASARTAPPIRPVGRDRRDRPLPLSFAQERLWFLDQMVPGGLYNIPFALRLEGPFDAAAWERSLGEIRRRHETLRTRFHATVQDPVQVIDPATPWPLPLIDLARLPATAREDEARRLLDEDARRPFDLKTGPVARAALVRLAARDHLALLTLHHTVSDGWSMDVLLDELERLYTAFATGRPSPLADLPVQYADFAVWQRQWLADDLLAAQLAYWRQRLEGDLVLALPTDRPAPPEQSFRGATFSARVPGDLGAGLGALGRRSGSTLFMVLAAAWSALLHRYTGKLDITVGTPIAGRNRPEIEGLIGFFANVLVLRSDLSGDPPFARLLDQVREVALGAYTHQDLPFEKLVEVLRPERRLDQNPLFQVVLSVEPTPVRPRWEGAGLGVRFVPAPAWSAKFDLHLAVVDAGENGLLCDWEYKTDLFDEATIARFAGHWERLLAAIVADPEARLGDLPLLTPAEAGQLQAWNPEVEVALPWASLHEGFAAQVARDPHAVAVTAEEGALTYGQLEERANRLAWRLAEEGVGPDVLVGLCAERSLDLVVGVLGILQAGGAYVPLDPAYPQERLALIAEDSGAKVVVAQAGVLERLARRKDIKDLKDPKDEKPEEAGSGLLSLESLMSFMSFKVVILEDAPSPARPLPAVAPGNAAYVIYTSGSTGKPKGVVVSHANALRLFAATDPWFGFGPGDSWTLFHSYAFDFSVWEIWGALLYGGRLVVVPYFVSRSPESFAGLLRRERITVLNQTPSAFDQLARVVLNERAPLADLRTVVFGGEAISLRALEPWLDRFGETPALVNMYGITETTVHVTWRPLSADDPRSGETPFGGPVGVPIPDLSVHLVDGHFREVPVGVPAEMLVGGAGLSRGYLNRPDLTAERFVPDPFSGKAGARLYRSGDLARRLPNGELEFLGRADAQVKIRGFRIEPGEIEAALGRLSEVGACAVLPRREPEGDTVLAAYVAPRPGAALPPSRRLREALLASLPEHMVPALFVEVEALPLTPSGKVDRRALARLEPAASLAEETAEQPQDIPRTPTEELLAGIWLAALGTERTGGRVGIHDDFFEHGGHSLLATQVVNRVRAAFGVDVPLRALFEAPTPAALAERIEAALLETVGAASARSAPPIVPVGRDHDLPLSFAQERLWFLDQMQLGNLYNVPLALHLTGPLDAAAWQASLDEIRCRHESLRTRFRAASQGAAQVIDPPCPWPAPVIDLAGLGEAEIEPEYRRIVREEAGRSFDLAAGPLVRAALIRLSATEHLALLTFHHIVADAWSLGVLLSELRQLYAAFAAARPSPLPELPVQYADFAVWQREWLRGEVLEAQLAYWRERLAGDPVLALPTDRPAPPVQTFRGTSWGERLPASFARRLADLGRGSGSTLFMVLLAGYTALLHRYTGSLDVAVGSAVANRNRPEIEGLIGFFLNTLVLRTGVDGEPTFADLLGRVRETALGAYTHQDLPFEKLVEEVRPERRLDQNPLFQVVLSFDRPAASLEQAGLSLRPVAVETRTAKFDLHLAIAELPELTGEDAGLYCAWEYKTDLFDEATIVRLAGHWASLLADAAAHPDRPVSRLEMLSAAERHQLAHEWNDTASAYPREATLPERFARQARLRPDAIALENAAGETLTYGGLAERAGRLASRLRGLGIGPEDRVAVALPRSFDLIAAFLGILEAGGAYVPLDPNYPTERLAFLLADSGARVLVTRPDFIDRVLVAGVPDVTILEWRGEDDAGDPGGILRDAPPLFPENLAYVMYTSGSTGRPKGVTATHRNVVRLVEETNYADLGPDETFLLFAPVSFDASTLEIWGSLLHGGRLVLAPEGRVSLSELGEAIRRGRVTSLWLTAGLFHQMVDEEIDGLAGLRQLLAGGDVISPEPARAVLERFPGLRLIDGYGPTEGTTFAACHTMRSPGEVRAPVPIGRPIAHSSTHVLDAHLEALPAGVPGELCLGGDGLARGYLDRPGLTAERFVPDPVSGVPGERLYRTGDIVRRLPDGTLEFLGRADLQVKVAGYRIEPTEVESVLDRHPAVGQSAVAVHDDPRAGRRLVAYVVPEAALTPSAELRAELRANLRDYLRAKLPEPMVPALFVLLDQLPLSPSGKVDRRALPEPTLEAQDAGTAETPRTPTEEILAGLWAEALGVERVGLHEDFFESGGHSLLATRVMSRVRQVFHADLSLRALFEEPTVAGLAAAIDRRRTEDAGPPPPEIERLPRGEGIQVHPVALAQRRLWFLHQLDPAGFFLTITQALRFRGALDAEALRRALEEVVARHEPLRTTFAAVEGQPVQRIAPPPALGLPRVDLSGLPEERREPEARRMAGHEGTAPFDLVRGPLLRPALVRLGADDQILLLSFHHLVFDGWSMDVLFRELSVLYEAFTAGRPSPLAPLPVQYADYAVWQRQVLSGPVLERQLAWWKERLGGVPALELPLDHPRPAVQRFVGDWHGVVLPPERVARLHEICRQQGVTLFMLLLAAVEVFLGRLSSQREFPVGTPIASRGRPEVEDLIGFFINTLVLPADLTGEPTFRDLLARVREAALGAYAHQDLPFEMLVNELSPERQLSTNPIFNVLWNLLEASHPAGLAGIQVEALDFEIDAAHFDLMVTGIREPDGSLTLVLNDKRDLFDRPTAQRMMDLLARLLDGVVDQPDRPVWDLPAFGESAWHQVRHEWNDAGRAFPQPVTAERLFEAQARRTPEALALAGPDEQLTYAEVEALANRLAHRLQRLGVGPEVLVAIAFERSVELIVSALAIWKAGGAYLPLDLAAPPERLANVIEDAGAPVVITRQRHAERFAQSAARVLSFEVERASLTPEGTESAAPPQRWSFPANRAYVIYTSGSTGRPKGVEVQHDTLCNLLWWLVDWLEIHPGARSNLAALPAFDASVYEIWAYLAMGASVHAPPPEITPSAREMLRWIAAEKITHGHLTTPQADRALSLERPGGLEHLRWLIAGGDRLHQRSALADSFDVVNIYGPTEATVGTTSAKVTRQELAPPRLPSIGTPVANAEVYVLDRTLRPVPFGSIGELYIGGRILSRGYLRRPDLEASRYLPNPLSAEPGARMYWTGDVVRYFPNGRIDFIGRSDHQVKIRGFRIELGEIESLLSAHPGIAEAVVVARQEPAGARLVAYVVPRNGSLPAGDLKDYLRVKLPDYMIPSAFVTLEALPLTSRDKVDRNALPAPTLPREAEGEAAAPLRGETEEKIARVWREVLQIDTFGGDDNFFDLGGHSLALVTIHERLQGELGRTLSLVDLFENPTIRSLALSLDRLAQSAAAGPAPVAEEEKRNVQQRADQQRAAQGWKERARQARPGGKKA